MRSFFNHGPSQWFGVAACLLLGGISKASAATSIQWEPLGLSGGGAMFSPAISPLDAQLMMVNCDMSAAYISEDGGHKWRMIHHTQLHSDTQCRPAFHPLDRNLIYASSGGQLRVSRDLGKTFSRIGNLKEGLNGEIAIHPSKPEFMLVGTRPGRCWLSTDAGVTWSRCNGPEGKVLRFYFSPSSMFAATDKGIWRSDDKGQTWADKTEGLPWKQVQGFAGGFNSEKNLGVLYCSIKSKVENGVFQGGIYTSRDGGETWKSAMGKGINVETKKADQYGLGPVAQYNQLLTTDTRPLTVYAMNTSTGFHPPHHETVYRSDDGGENWRDTYFIDPRFKRYNVAPDYVTASTGQSFKGGGTPFGVAICNSAPNSVLLVRDECHITHDGGESWFAGHTSPAPGQKPGPGSSWLCSGLVVTTTWNYYIDPHEANRHYIAYTDNGFARSTDSGRSWIWWNQKTWAPWRNTCYELAFDRDVPGLIWGAFSNVHDIPNDNIISGHHGHNGPGGVCVSRDFAASWKSETTGLPRKPVTSIVLDPKSARDARTLYAGVFGDGVYKSIDSGKNWTLKKSGLGHPDNMQVYRVILHSDGTLFAIICGKRPAAGQPLMKEGVGLYRSS